MGSGQPAISVSALYRHFPGSAGEPVRAVDGVDLSIEPGEFLVLLGPSGCGKTTLLRSLAGLETPDKGEIFLGDRVVFSSKARIDVPPHKRGLSMVFQSYALWPHMTAFGNVAFPLQARKLPKADISTRALEALSIVGIPELADRHPANMSGGQQQRVALARAIVARDRVVLFDEPLSNVDAKVREDLRLELLQLHEQLGFAAVYVTHDQQEAMEMATRVAVMKLGKVAQIGRPEQVYRSPESLYVADFIGTTNKVSGVVRSIDDGKATLVTDLGEVVGRASTGTSVGQDAVAVWRPENASLAPTGTGDAETVWQGTVVRHVYAGAHTDAITHVGGYNLRTRQSTTPPAVGEAVNIHVKAEDIAVLPPDSAIEVARPSSENGHDLT